MKERTFAILIALLMTLSFIANVGAVVVDLTPDYAKPGDTIQVLSYEIVGPVDGTNLTAVDIGFNGTVSTDVEWAKIYVEGTLFGTLYGPVGTIWGNYQIPEGVTVTVKLNIKIKDTAEHGHEVDGLIVFYTLTESGDPGTDPQPIDPLGHTIIDDEKPFVVDATADPDPAKAGPVVIYVEFSEAMDMGVAPTVTVTGLNSSYTAFGNFADPYIWVGFIILIDEDEVGTAYISVSGGKDLAGNVMDPAPTAGSFQVDTIEPTLIGIGVSDDLITEADVGNPFEITVTYNENMDMSVHPTINLSPDITPTLPSLTGSWVDGTHYVLSCPIADGNQEVAHVSVTASGAQDIAGNPQGSYGLMHLFAIDNEEPTATATADPDPAKAGPVTVTVEFSEAMGVSPTVEVTGLKSTYPVLGSLQDPDTWVGSFNLIDEDEVDTALISVSLGQDLAGNVMDPAPTAGSFNVDTIEPTVNKILVSDNLITEADVGHLFTVDVVFSEAMNTTATPTINFDPDVEASGTLIFDSDAWVMGDTVYTTNYTVDDVDEEEQNIIVSVGGAQDLAGNLQVPDPTGVPLFSVDTKAPFILSSLLSDYMITEADIGSIFIVSLGFSEPITPIPPVEDIVIFSPDVPGTLSFVGFALPTPWDLVFSYAIFDGDQETYVDVIVEGVIDLAGNHLVPITYADEFSIDNLEPTVTITIADPINLANVGAVSVNITSDQDGTYSYDVGGITDGGAITAGMPIELLLDLSGLADGPVTADASVEDAAGNVGHAPQDTATKDTVEPVPYEVFIFLITDADTNGIANIGDTLNVMVDMTGNLDTVSVTADLRAYGGSEVEVLEGLVLWTANFTIVDSPTGIDVGPNNLTSAVTVTVTDDVGNTATGKSNNLTESVDSLAPEPPTGLTATAIAEGKIRLDWTASVALDLASYNIYRDTILVAEGVTGTTWTDEGPLVDGQEYYYGMRSVDDADNIGDYSEEANATSDSTPPIAPTLDAPDYINIANQNAYPVSGLAEPGSTVDVGLTDGVGFANATGSADAVSGQFTITVDASGLDDGDVNISARATDTVGNIGLWSAPPITVIKDTVAPTVTITIPEYINLSNVESVSVIITSDEAGTYSYEIDGISDGGVISAIVPVDFLLDLNGLPDGPVTAHASVEDAAGNVGHAEQDTATKDTVAPTVTIEIPEYINLANVAEVPVIITSDEAGTYSYDIDGISDGGVISVGVPVDFLLDLNSLPDGPVTADASVEDAAGNVGHAEQDTATKDTVEPVAVDFNVSDILISDADVPGPFEVIVNFSEPMDTTFLPDIDFIPSVFSTLDFTGGLWSDLDTVYTATFEIFDAGVEVLHVNLTIAGFVDIAGNFAFEQKNGTDVFDIDTKNPTVIGLEISDLWIREDDLPGPLTVTVNFSEPMSVAPNIGFNPDVSMTLLFDSDDWSVDSTVYTANYTIADVNEEASGIAITVEDAEDIAGNLQVQYATDALFEIDTLHTTSEPVSIEVKANGEDSITVEIVDDVQLVATVLNWFGEPVSDEVLVLFETNFGTIYPDIVLTEDGEAETPISSTGVGTANVNATVDGISDSCTVTFVEQTFEIQLSLGWNLISVPRTLAYPAIEEVFAGITTIEKVWTYQNGEWYGAKYENGTLTPIPGYLLEEIDDGKGYWIYTSEPVNITMKLKPLEYLALPPSYPLPAEWNLIGYTSILLDEGMPIDSYLIYVEWSTLYRFGPYTYEIAKPGFYKYFDSFELGRGYWIHLNEEGTLVP